MVGDAGTTPRLDAGLEQRRIVIERCAEEGLVSEEHDDELRRRLELLPVPLLTELRHVLADETRVALEVRAPRRVVVRLDRVEVRLEGRLGVDDEALPAGKLHHEIGSQQPAFAVTLARLLREVAVGQHPGKLDDPLELHLAPPSPHVRRA